MFLNYLKIAWRQLQKKAFLSGLKIFGLGVGIAASILLIKYINWQWNFDKFHTQAAEIVRIENDHFRDGILSSRNAMTSAGVPVVAKENFPEVLNYVRLGRWIANDVVFRHDENLYRGKNCFFTEPAFFDIFSFPMVSGDPKTALQAPNSIVLTVSTAKKLFGDQDPINQEILFENFKTFKVTGIVEDPPTQSHIQFDILGSLSTMTNWGLEVYSDHQLSAIYVYAYLQLAHQTDLPKLASELTQKIKELKADQSGQDVYKLQPLKSIHLYSQLDREMEATGQGNNIWILAGIALLILILGWVNHFNLFVATTTDQAQAISIRKIVGAGRGAVFTQIWISSSTYTILAIVAGLLLATFIQPLIESTYNVPFGEISLRSMTLTEPAFYLILLLVFGTLGNTIIPAIFLSKIRPVELLNKKMMDGPNNFSFRKILVTTQFVIIISLIAGTSIIFQQTRHMQSQDLGMTLDQVIAIKAPLGVHYDQLKLSFPEFERKIIGIPGVEMLSASHFIPGNQLELIDKLEVGERDYAYSFYRNYGHHTYYDLYDMPMLAKLPVINKEVEGKRYAIVNRMASELLGFNDPEKALGINLLRWGREVEIVGVVENYHQRSLHHHSIPVIYDFSADNVMSDGYYSIKVGAGTDKSAIIATVKQVYQDAFPHTVFDPIDVLDDYNSQYIGDDNFKQLNLTFTLLALIIACLGLLGLMILTLERRTKEIGIRKVLGASVSNLVFLLSKNILQLTFIAWIIATPISWYLMKQWLNHFSSRIEIGWSVFLWAALFVVMASFLTTGYHALKAALVNPATILRDE